jgi:hypothetical protein
VHATKSWMAGPPGQARWHASPAMTKVSQSFGGLVLYVTPQTIAQIVAIADSLVTSGTHWVGG